jgi:hypothetical protein
MPKILEAKYRIILVIIAAEIAIFLRMQLMSFGKHQPACGLGT